jgi:ACT domain-containing protein
MTNKRRTKMKAVITVTGKDSMGIIAKVSSACAENGANIIDITQSVMREYFAMIMLADIDSLKVTFSEFVDKLAELGHSCGLEIHAMHEDIFDTMHHV